MVWAVQLCWADAEPWRVHPGRAPGPRRAPWDLLTPCGPPSPLPWVISTQRTEHPGPARRCGSGVWTGPSPCWSLHWFWGLRWGVSKAGRPERSAQESVQASSLVRGCGDWLCGRAQRDCGQNTHIQPSSGGLSVWAGGVSIALTTRYVTSHQRPEFALVSLVFLSPNSA